MDGPNWFGLKLNLPSPRFLFFPSRRDLETNTTLRRRYRRPWESSVSVILVTGHSHLSRALLAHRYNVRRRATTTCPVRAH